MASDDARNSDELGSMELTLPPVDKAFTLDVAPGLDLIKAVVPLDAAVDLLVDVVPFDSDLFLRAIAA